jgi:hypothetical protein
MHDIGGLIWIVVVLFAVISSIVKSARRARAVPATSVRSAQPPAQSRPQLASLIAQFAQEAQTHAAPPATVQAPPPARPKPVASVPSPVVTAAPVALHVEAPRPRVTGLFADRGALVRGIIAAEVLGKPLALRDE